VAEAYWRRSPRLRQKLVLAVAEPSVAAITGLAFAAIVAAAAIEITLIFAVYEGYDEVELSKGRLILRRKADE
jgi:hypothetical protein